MAEAIYKRIMLKLSGEALAGDKHTGLDFDVIGQVCDVIKEAARFAGCHIYSETDDVFYANRNYITIHGAHSGLKTIHLPQARGVYDVYTGECCGKAVTSFSVSILKGQTRMFRLV